jgi:TetR/AcrR family transcriptional regulator
MNTATSIKHKKAKVSVEELKQDILRVALRHFALKGLSNTNMDDIAEELGIHKPSIYYHIGKKEVLFEAVINAALDKHLHELNNKLERTATPQTKLKAYIMAFADNLSGENRYLANLLLRNAANEDGYFPLSAMEKMKQIQKILQEILAEGIRKDVFKPINPFMIHMLIVSFFHTYAAGEHIKNRMVEISSDDDIFSQDISLQESADMIYGMLLDALTSTSE